MHSILTAIHTMQPILGAIIRVSLSSGLYPYYYGAPIAAAAIGTGLALGAAYNWGYGPGVMVTGAMVTGVMVVGVG